MAVVLKVGSRDPQWPIIHSQGVCDVFIYLFIYFQLGKSHTTIINLLYFIINLLYLLLRCYTVVSVCFTGHLNRMGLIQ